MIFSKLKQILFPDDYACIVCGSRGVEREEHGGAVLCDGCIKHFNKVKEPTCIKCGRQLKIADSYCRFCAETEFCFEKGASVYRYEGDVRECVHKLKYNNEPWLAKFAAKEMAAKYKELSWQCDTVTFVPMHHKKQFRRGYNQAEELARCFGELAGVKEEELLKRTKNTVPQSHMEEKERCENVRDIFELNVAKEEISGKSILLIDDIITTGSSVNECAKVLLNCGYSKVFVLCMCSVDG